MEPDPKWVRAFLLDLKENCNGVDPYRPTKESVGCQNELTDEEFTQLCLYIAGEGYARRVLKVCALDPKNDGVFFLSLTQKGIDELYK